MKKKGLGFSIEHTCTQIAENKNFILHNHSDMYEILMFIKGDSEFWVEGSIYPLTSGDIIVASNFEMHRVYHNSQSEYERIVINVEPYFFTMHDCEQYKNIFINRTIGENNRISAEVSKKYGLAELMLKIKKYYDDIADNGIAATAAMVEFLYLLNRASEKTQERIKNTAQIKDIIFYINSSLNEKLTLDEIALKFYISKGHLCRTFKDYTGYTVNGYITYKRLMNVRTLVSDGISWTDAVMESGFSSYSNFYRAYCKTYGEAPHEFGKNI